MAVPAAQMPWLDELSEDWGTEEVPEEPPADANEASHLSLAATKLENNGKVN